jgi:glycosyltransferase involved in cell wall biosynthesis
MTTKKVAFQIPSISVVIPVFNLQNKISFSLEKIKRAVESAFTNYELIAVNDGSTDKTLTILRGIENADPHVHVLSYNPNRGKGYAIRQGIKHSQGNAVIFLDGDLNISPELIKDYVEKLSIFDLVIASKRHPESRVTIPKSRMILSRAFNLIVKMATGIPQKDTQAGFKVGDGEVMRTIFRYISVNRYAFDVELFIIASILHLKVHDMPVIMKIERRFSTKDLMNMSMDITRIWFRYRIAHHYQHQFPRRMVGKKAEQRVNGC